MSYQTLLALGLLTLAQRYPHLPPEATCAALTHVAEHDLQQIDCRLRLVTGWQRQQLQEARQEAQRIHDAWYAAWWLQWRPANQQLPHESQLLEYETKLLDLLGVHAFYRGESPLPWGFGQ
jgi:hypothetical protein